jgi:hypothetical protein
MGGEAALVRSPDSPIRKSEQRNGARRVGSLVAIAVRERNQRCLMTAQASRVLFVRLARPRGLDRGGAAA